MLEVGEAGIRLGVEVVVEEGPYFPGPGAQEQQIIRVFILGQERQVAEAQSLWREDTVS
jgi:hypothetical protein